jgi:hypothetical protein
LEVPLGLPFTAGLDAAFLFFFASATCEIMTSVGFRARSPLSTRKRGSRPTFPAFDVASNNLRWSLRPVPSTAPCQWRPIVTASSEVSSGSIPAAAHRRETSAGLRKQAPVKI